MNGVRREQLGEHTSISPTVSTYVRARVALESRASFLGAEKCTHAITGLQWQRHTVLSKRAAPAHVADNSYHVYVREIEWPPNGVR